jgi:rhamnulokinase
MGWHEIVALSNNAKPFKSLINPDDASFLNPGDMPKAVQDYCVKTNQPIPQSKGEIARCIYDSLVLKYKYTLRQIESVTGKKIERLHIIGGGAHNSMMNQLTADATGIEVLAGPTEATAIGNILMQAKAVGKVNSLAEMRDIVSNSFEITKFKSSPKLDWEAAYKKFEKLLVHT